MIPPSRPPRRKRAALLPPPAREVALSLQEQETRRYRRLELPTPASAPEGPNGTCRMARRAFEPDDVAEAERGWWDRAQKMARRKSIRPGDLIAGRFRVERAQRDGNALTISAVHEGFDRPVRLRLVPREHAAGTREQLLREARALARFETDHVARIVDAGVLRDDSVDGAIFLAREYVAGESLVELVKDELDVELALTWFSQIAEAVQEAHSHGIVLRDLRLSQIVIATRSCGERIAKLLDLGNCTGLPRADDDGSSVTALRVAAPTVSPELLRGDRGEARSDVWSLGCLLYQLLTGQPAFTGAGARLMMAIQNDEPEPLRHWRRDLPAQIDEVIRWAIHKDPARRAPGVRALVDAAWSASGLRPPAAAQRALARMARLDGTAGEVVNDASPWAMPEEPPQEDAEAPARLSVPELESSFEEIQSFVSDGSLDEIGGSSDDVILTDSAQMWMHAMSIRPPRRKSGRRAVLLGAAIACLPGMLLFAAALDEPEPLHATALVFDLAAWHQPVAEPDEPEAEPVVPSGSLVVMASGGSCQIDVDGEPKGQGTHITVPVAVGTHHVTCLGSDGVLRTRAVAVTSEQAGVTVFRF